LHGQDRHCEVPVDFPQKACISVRLHHTRQVAGRELPFRYVASSFPLFVFDMPHAMRATPPKIFAVMPNGKQ
jgi:hypothetical protein